jgi:peptidoglycan/LPS O-acetylase OafA/YrhL
MLTDSNSTKIEQRLTYRPDVDGLRALAVLLVVCNHISTRVTGGYVGVDVFFVISGYLISSVILKEMAAGTFSVGTFYERRIRRIFPALLGMLLVSSVLAYLFLAPSDLIAFAQSLLAALLSVSNFLFWDRASYFDTLSALKPLLHTWSLAVEEQFYIFFPLFLMLVRRWSPKRLKAAIWSVTVLTFLPAWACVQRDATAAFFFAPLRAWELLIGAIVSQRYLPSIHGRLARQLAATTGLSFIVVPAMLYTAWTVFPGPAALLPCLGAALLIAAGDTGDSIVGRLLSSRPVVFIGLISYSLYLWHWPILVFYKSSYAQILPSVGTWPDKAAVFLASLIAATLSWRYIETPFRKGAFRPDRRALILMTATAGALILTVGGIMIFSGRLPGRFPSDALVVDRYTNYDFTAAFRRNVCFIDPVTRFGTFADFNKPTCLAEDRSRKQYLLMGDSHAAHYYPGLTTVFPELNISQATTAACKPFLTQPDGIENYCVSMWKYIYGDYLLHHHVDAVMMSGHWNDYDFPELERTTAWLTKKGIQVILFGPTVEFDVPLPRLLAFSLRDHKPGMIDSHFLSKTLQTDRRLQEVARNRWKVRYISAFEDLCTPKLTAKIGLQTAVGCPVYAARGVPLLFDADHLTPEASILYARTMRARNQLP